MRNFHLDRLEDATGISGTGRVAEGVQFSNGWCAMTWLTENTSVAFYPSIETLEAIHGHEGRTKVVFSDEHEHEWLIDESHPQIVAEVACGTGRWNRCMSCGATRLTSRS